MSMSSQRAAELPLDPHEADEPLFAPGAGGLIDYCTRDGADSLRRKIEAYWKERGSDVMVTLHNVGFHPAIRAARYEIRSDLVNGLPRGRAKRAANSNDEPA